ncbi:NB-ARC domain-containing protein [Mycena kentingensis (nom. inval.)]|nr:NB-ARC domain-containing protein [Mycena kentingensis (nom. inval.)]
MRETPSKIPTSVIEKTLPVVTALKHASEGVSAPYLKAIVGVAVLILESAQSIRVNKQHCALLLERIHDVLGHLTALLNEDMPELPPLVVDELSRLLETMQKVETYIRAQQDVGRIRRLLRQQQTATQLEECKDALESSANIFKMNTFTALARLEQSAEAQQQEMLQLLQKNPSLVSFSKFSFVSGASTLSLLLPSAPQIFHGRESDVQNAVNLLLQDSANVVVLGPGGIGKTALAKTVMHHAAVTGKFAQRYFVACDSTRTVSDVAFALAAALGLEIASKPGAAVLHHLGAQSASLVVLDNFETPWEDETTRAAVEDFLVSLAELPQVGLLVTMRGQERPTKVKWSRPFLPPLAPLRTKDALETFVEIADPDDVTSSEDISKLLALTGNVPLAVTLMAAIASNEGCAAVLERWSTENVALLSEGEDKDHSLTASIRVSLSSPRLQSTPGALELLAILSLLPDGLIETDLQPGIIPIERPLAAKIALMRTALAYHDAGRLKVLAPVREAITALHPPAYLSLLRPLRVHWECLYRPWRAAHRDTRTDFRRLFVDMGNYKSVLQYGLKMVETENRAELKELLEAFFMLHAFYVNLDISLLSPEIEGHVERLDDDTLRLQYLLHRLRSTKIMADPQTLVVQALKYARNAQNVEAEAIIYREAARRLVRNNKLELALEQSTLACAAAERLPHRDTNTTRQNVLVIHAQILCLRGRPIKARDLAEQALWIAERNGDFDNEVHALEEGAAACIELGDFPAAVAKLLRVQRVFRALGVDGMTQEVSMLDLLADVYLHQTAYLDARDVHRRMVELSSPKRHPLFHANSILELVSIDVELGRLATEEEVVAALKPAQNIFDAHGFRYAAAAREGIFGTLFHRTGRLEEAKTRYQQSLRLRTSVLRLVKMADLSLESAPSTTIHWAGVLIAYAKLNGSRPSLAWGLRFLGEWMGSEDAIPLFRVALHEFERMDIIRGRAACVLALAGLDGKNGEAQRSEARELFLRCGLTMEANNI